MAMRLTRTMGVLLAVTMFLHRLWGLATLSSPVGVRLTRTMGVRLAMTVTSLGFRSIRIHWGIGCW